MPVLGADDGHERRRNQKLRRCGVCEQSEYLEYFLISIFIFNLVQIVFKEVSPAFRLYLKVKL